MFKRLNKTTNWPNIALSILLLLMSVSARSQNSMSKELLSVRCDIIGKGSPTICSNIDTLSYYSVMVSIVNNQDTTINLTITTCAWIWDNFVTNTDSVLFTSCFLGCDNNVVDGIAVPPKKAARFFATLRSNKKKLSSNKIRIGFRYFATGKDMWKFNGLAKNNNLYKLFWSNEVELKDNMYSYDVE